MSHPATQPLYSASAISQRILLQIPAIEVCGALHSSAEAAGSAPLLHLLETHPLVFNVYNSR
jgi:hypothetical protein